MTEEKLSQREGGPATKRVKAGSRGIPQRKIEYKQDAGYRFDEPAVKESQDEVEFYPVHFLRTHSKNNDPADVQTQIWQCLFEPNVEQPQHMTDVVATCGGSSVCFINVDDGEVILKYNRNAKTASGVENLYALTWSTLSLDEFGLKRMNILAAAGARSTVLLIHPDAGVCYQMFRTVPNKAAAVVCSLLFYPKKATWLFCGHEDGQIQLWDVGIPSLPSYETTPVHLMTIPPVARDVYNLAYSHSQDLLIGGCDGGLHAWKIDMQKIENNERLERTEFILPEVDGNGSVLDSVCMVRDDLLAAKCALHGQIYIFSLAETLKLRTESKAANVFETVVSSDMMLKLRWSDTDNYYMNMGVDTVSCILVCGDDKGTLWVYDLVKYVTGTVSSPITGGSPVAPVEPVALLDWPELEDAEVEKARKLRLDTYDIVVDKCAVSPNGRHIVAVTSNNMVCIWKRGKEDENEQSPS
ncbi:leucine-rich repeat and WD repeat-containing protein 1-like [Penaeus monodon]|uniref:leucine-rich repeat and WD repeat-containing protein 1-like n=1 Tax=Penaeus monodon TaxID=6687 RepID=UPI0018A7D5BA|nr:leucine-rich repeat and WD repeat-containing protein 1-like [Penaeus monodon]XP_037783933.1 leucine-rich repeat and WD repeat-containing protein 1-like [Penaeus monodon]XP_037783934.1 leucine-rich repeat and WD repeat-containing protein 1-like [Penaeus monodon]XP_037783935.1 leucine-rich repeat and WD repeat-containing protein 1-like [Penaeus monodon]XP_037783936.1 leucine-rich repeat and WD repeat-containing protein 1-like [Penaeus monodon]XP_037783937.1 leucine-rich repeat and WD repeat-c